VFVYNRFAPVKIRRLAATMETTPPQIALDELQAQHETLPILRSALPLSSTAPTATQTLILNHPSAKLASSPASSPRIIDPPLDRRESVHISKIDYMEHGIAPGADFFDDQSSGSEWEDEEEEQKTSAFPDFEELDRGMGVRSLLHEHTTKHRKSRSRGRSKDDCMITALPAFPHVTNNISDSGAGHRQAHRSFQVYGKATTRARHMSLTRLGRDHVKVVHNPGSTSERSSLSSNATDETTSHFPKSSNSFLREHLNLDTSAGTAQNVRHHHSRSDTPESMMADSVINAHFNTMRALKALSPSSNMSQPLDRSFLHSDSTDFPAIPSFSNGRRINLSPLSIANRDNLPSHFVKTPYPFTAKKEFPKPTTRPRQHNMRSRLDSGYAEDSANEYDDRKGKHVLGLVPSDGSYDLRSRLERNEDAQGLISASSPLPPATSTLWLSLSKRSTTSRHLARIDIPRSLTTLAHDHPIDFDDTYLASRLRAAHTELAGSRFKRAFSARSLSHIQLAHLNTWSAESLAPPSPTRLLAARAGTDASPVAADLFTEDALMTLYRAPRNGKARYTWVHWAQRVAQSHLREACPQTQTQKQSQTRLPRRLNEKTSSTSSSTVSPSDVLTTVQFVHTLRTTRIALAVCLILCISAAACLAWVFLGTAVGGGGGGVEGRGARVLGGVAVGALVLAMQGCVFAVWVVRS
jgi:hypothetical protein